MLSPYFRQRVNAVQLIEPKTLNATTGATSSTVNRIGAYSAQLVINNNAVTGSATAATATITINTSANSDMSSPTVFATLTANVLASGVQQWCLALDGAAQYVQVVVAMSYTGGESPATGLSAELVLGDYDIDPPVTETVYGA